MTRVGELKKTEEELNTYAGQLEQTLVGDQRERQALLARIMRLEEALAARERDQRSLRASKAKIRQSLDRQKLLNAALLKSTSWRVTSPLRAAVDAYRTFRNVLSRVAPDDREKIVSPEAARFFREGFIAPVDLFTPSQCELIMKHFRLGARQDRTKGRKGLAAYDRFFYDFATRPALLALLKPLLGEDIILWGASVTSRQPGRVHDWHTDIESSALDGRFVSVWVGLENTCKESALQLVSRSHKFGKPVQQVVHERGLRRGDATSEVVTAWAREHESAATIVQPEMTDGQAIVFDGRLWHASHNTSRAKRSALLLQYAAAGTPIAFPDLNQLDEWPFRFTSDRPKSLLVCGNGEESAAVPRPAGFPTKPLPIKTHMRGGEGFLESGDGWKPYHLFKGSTPILAGMRAHVSVLSPGHSPHPPHSHVEEELLIVLEGEAEILVADSPEPGDAAVARFVPGSLVYYPAYQHHTIRNVSAAPVTYLMFKWQAPSLEVDHPLETMTSDVGGRLAAPRAIPRTTRLLFQGPTAYLGKLHAHVTELQPNGGYEPHADKYDVAILVFSGIVETLGKTVGSGGSIYYSAGQLHGMRNVGDTPAKYLVLEFHGQRAG